MKNPRNDPDPGIAQAPGGWDDRRWLLAVVVASALLVLRAALAFALEIQPGQHYHGVIVACGTQREAETLRGFVVSGDVARLEAYLRAADNSCSVGPRAFVVVAQIGVTKTDVRGKTWKLVKIKLADAEAYLITTANLIVGQAT